MDRMVYLELEIPLLQKGMLAISMWNEIEYFINWLSEHREQSDDFVLLCVTKNAFWVVLTYFILYKFSDCHKE